LVRTGNSHISVYKQEIEGTEKGAGGTCDGGRAFLQYLKLFRGAWLAQSEEHATLDLGVVSSSPIWV